MRTAIKLACAFWLFFVLLSFVLYPKSGEEIKYILKISWQDKTHGKVRRYWVLEKTNNLLHEYETLKLNEKEFKVTPLVFPRFSDEYLFCCEKQDINAINAIESKLLVDSLNKKYTKQYQKYYSESGERIKLNLKKAQTFTQDTLETKFEISFFKVKALFCRCRSSINNPGSVYTDSMAIINRIIEYNKITRKEIEQIKINYKTIFTNKMIQEELPIR